MFAVLSDLWVRWTDQGSQLCWFRRNEAGGNILQDFAPSNCCPTLWDGGLPETDQLARRRVGTGEQEHKHTNIHLQLLWQFSLVIISLSIILQCTTSCGGGSRERQVICSDQERNLYPMDQCNANPKPSTVERCNTQPCYSPQGDHMQIKLLN